MRWARRGSLPNQPVSLPVRPHERAAVLISPFTGIARLWRARNFIRDAVVRGVVSPSSYLISVEAGYDIRQASGSPGLTTSSFSVSPATGTPTGPIVSALWGRLALLVWSKR